MSSSDNDSSDSDSSDRDVPVGNASQRRGIEEAHGGVQHGREEFPKEQLARVPRPHPHVKLLDE